MEQFLQQWNNSNFSCLIRQYDILTRLCIKTGIQERGAECGKRRKWGGMLYSGECRQTFRGMSSNIPGMWPNIPRNVLKHSGECPQAFRGMSPNIPGNVVKHSGECRQTFRGMSPNDFYQFLQYGRVFMSSDKKTKLVIRLLSFWLKVILS